MDFKADLEVLVEEQTQHIDAKNKRIRVVEEEARVKDIELDKKEGMLRRLSSGVTIFHKIVIGRRDEKEVDAIRAEVAAALADDLA